jgi:hypothetical protein
VTCLTNVDATLPTVEITATPTAAPSSCPVVIRPDAIPAAFSPTSLIAVDRSRWEQEPDAEPEDDEHGQQLGRIAVRAAGPGRS